jgi:predicted phage terminase large subunit-like protein
MTPRLELSAAQLRLALEQRRQAEAIAQDAVACVASFRYFVSAAWPLVEPATVFAPGWHIDAICDHLQAAARGEIRRLLINMPPRHMKSLAVSVFWPVWLWTWTPHLRFLTASYGANLAERDAIRSRDLLRSTWFHERWPELELKADVNRVNRYENNQSGYRLATGVGGEATGEGGDILIIDDPHKLEEALSDTARARVIDWHDGTLATRFNDPKTGVEVVVMQRPHERDLAGHLLEHDGWTHLCLPARYEPAHPFHWPDDPRTTPGELLWPTHVPEAELRRIEQTLGSYRVAGQLQQRPAALEGELLKRGWWQYYPAELLNEDRLGELPRFQRIVSSWDTAFKDRTTSDYVVGQIWGIHKGDRYLLYCYRQRASLQQTKDAMRVTDALARKRWPGIPHNILIEKSANGVEIISELRRELTGIHAITVSTDKITRAIAAAPALESGNVFVPGRPEPGTAAGYSAPDWVASLIEEAASFPNGQHDDQVDAFSQAINWVRTQGSGRGSSSVPRGRIDQPRLHTHQPRVAHGQGWPLASERRLDHPARGLDELASYIGLPITNPVSRQADNGVHHLNGAGYLRRTTN